MSRGRSWTAGDTAELRRLAARGDNDFVIAEEMDRDRSMIVRKRQEYGIERGQSAGLTAMVARLNLRRLMRRAARV